MKKISFIAFFSLVSLCAIANLAFPQKTLKVGDVLANPGDKKSGFIKVPKGTDCPEIQIPITIINGAKGGPILALTAGIHGYEYPPILALQRLRKQVESSRISGAVIMVHVVNMPSFLKRTIYYNPYDWKNQNRVFPGKKNGSMTERIAYQISKEVIDQCDYLIDMHCGDGNEDLMPYLYCTKTGDEALDSQTRELAKNFGFKVIIHESVKPNESSASHCANSALLKGKPALTVESGKLGKTDEEDIIRVIKGTYNTLKHLKMIPGNPELLFEPVCVKSVTYIRSEHKGIFYPLSHSGRHVQKGELLGYLTDFFGNIIQKAIAPHDGIIMYIIATPPMSKGEPMVKIGSFI
jgi:predicted deacylase